ncbi:MAG: serine/threonine protein kinase [Verrucomicrobiaceae bacterium]|nr:serine/threonine protein kinase [Verrucomicrobiaceae bacterium]
MKCPACGSLITRTEEVVKRDTFRQALNRARLVGGIAAGSEVLCGGERYVLLQLLGSGSASEVHLARRVGQLPLLVTMKLSIHPADADSLKREAENLRALHAVDGSAGVYAAQRLPEVIACSMLEDGSARLALILRHPNGFWGSLSALGARFPQGIDPRHAVWIWRRMLDVLHFIHAQGWTHGSISPEHALVHPQDHGVRLVGWAVAQKNATPQAQAADLMRSARVVQVLLGGASSADTLPAQVPPTLASLVTRAAKDEAFCIAQGASGIDSQLVSAARDAFGPPVFVPLTL